jgi:hypothetical protein
MTSSRRVFRTKKRNECSESECMETSETGDEKIQLFQTRAMRGHRSGDHWSRHHGLRLSFIVVAVPHSGSSSSSASSPANTGARNDIRSAKTWRKSPPATRCEAKRSHGAARWAGKPRQWPLTAGHEHDYAEVLAGVIDGRTTAPRRQKGRSWSSWSRRGGRQRKESTLVRAVARAEPSGRGCVEAARPGGR